MKDLIIKKNKLRDDAMKLSNAKFDDKVKNKYNININEEQNKIWNKYKFYENMINAVRKEKK